MSVLDLMRGVFSSWHPKQARAKRLVIKVAILYLFMAILLFEIDEIPGPHPPYEEGDGNRREMEIN